MAFEFEDILAQVACPTCGASINVPFQQLRVFKAAACGCGNLLRPTDDTSISIIQMLIDEAKPTDSEDD